MKEWREQDGKGSSVVHTNAAGLPTVHLPGDRNLDRPRSSILADEWNGTLADQIAGGSGCW
jgi:hypothetical protein